MGEFNVNKSDGSLEQTAGMPSEYPATQVMLNDGVTSVEDRLDANTLGDSVDISSYTSSNPYTAPSDGYARLDTSDTANLSGRLYVDNQLLCLVDNYKHIGSVYVRKGMTIYCSNMSASSHAKFIPIS